MDSKTPILKQAWDKYYASLDTARREIESSPHFADPVNQAQAYNCLVEAQAIAYNQIVAPRFNHPRIFTHTAWSTYVYSIPGNCPDIIYSVLPLDGRYTYRVRGRHADVRLLVMQVYSKPWGVAGSQCIGNYEFAKCDTGDDIIELTLSATPHEGNWIRLDAESDFNFVTFRRFLLDWNEDPGEIEVEMLGEFEGYDEQSESAMARRIDMAGDYTLALIRNYAISFFDFALKTAGSINTWACIPGEKMNNIAGSSSCNYGFLPFDIQPDEAVLIEMEVPANTLYCGLQLCDIWSKGLDFMHAQTDFNLSHAAIDSDNKLRAVISISDPGVPNWLDPIGRSQGFCCLRNYRSTSFTNPTARLVKLDALRGLLPAGTPTITAEERRKSVARRRPAILRLYRG